MVANFSKNKKGRHLGAPWIKLAGVMFLAATFFLAYQNIKIYRKKQQLSEKIQNYKKQIEEIKRNSEELKKEIANSDDADYIEKIAYEQLDQQRPGEREIIFSMPGKKPDAPNEQKKFWTGWLSGAWLWLKNRF